jgi:hypothetical protein
MRVNPKHVDLPAEAADTPEFILDVLEIREGRVDVSGLGSFREVLAPEKIVGVV